MKIVFLTSYYEAFLNVFYTKHPGFGQMSYQNQTELLAAEHFGIYGPYAHFAALEGHETQLIVVNCEPMQRTWAKEMNVEFDSDWKFTIAAKQVIAFRPDVFFMGSMFSYYGKFIDDIRPYCKKIFGWVACPIPPGIKFNQFDLILSSAVNYVDFFRKENVNSELLPAAFDTRIWDCFKNETIRDIPCSFVGGLSNIHSERVEIVRAIANKIPMKIWGYGYKEPKGLLNRYFNNDSIKKYLIGEAWGTDMYKIYARSKISINVHIAEAKDHSGNMRMYETTGLGALLLTDRKTDGNQFWIPGKEVLEYESVSDAIDKIKYFLSHDEERSRIAEAGQKRTHEEYNFTINTRRMLSYFKKLL